MSIEDVARDTKVILIVEDQILLGMGLKDELEDCGYRVLKLATRNGEAMSLARADKPDLALVNIHLAGGDDGVELARELRAFAVPVMFISGQGDKAREGKAFAIASLSKPYSPADMVAAVDYILHQRRGNAAPRCPSRLEIFGLRPAP
jgi:DNA-binding response OmpR family regulator